MAQAGRVLIRTWHTYTNNTVQVGLPLRICCIPVAALVHLPTPDPSSVGECFVAVLFWLNTRKAQLRKKKRNRPPDQSFGQARLNEFIRAGPNWINAMPN